jgi:hypothetical protein
MRCSLSDTIKWSGRGTLRGLNRKTIVDRLTWQTVVEHGLLFATLAVIALQIYFSVFK